MKKKNMVMKTMFIVDLLKDINQSFHNEDPAYHVLPETRDLAAQYLLLMKWPAEMTWKSYVTGDMRLVNLQVQSKLVSHPAFIKK